MNEDNRPKWEALPEAIRAEWIRDASGFYAPGAVSDIDLAAVARENYEFGDSLHPAETEQEATR